MKRNETKTTQAQRDFIVELLACDKWEQASGAASVLGFEGVNAEFFEYLIRKDGLHSGIIRAIAVYYDNDLNLQKFIKEARE